MKNRYFLPFIVLGALLCSCARETGVDVPREIKLKEILLDASLSGTKVNLNSSGLQPFWQEGDKIAVYDDHIIIKLKYLDFGFKIRYTTHGWRNEYTTTIESCETVALVNEP